MGSGRGARVAPQVRVSNLVAVTSMPIPMSISETGELIRIQPARVAEPYKQPTPAEQQRQREKEEEKQKQKLAPGEELARMGETVVKPGEVTKPKSLGEQPAPFLQPSPRPEPAPEPAPAPQPAPTPVKAPPKAPPKKPPKKPPIRLLLPPKGATNKEKIAHIRSQTGAVTQNMGKLLIDGKLQDVWHTKVPGSKKIIVTFGEPPIRANIKADGRGSAERTTQTLGGLKDFKPFSIVHGAVRTTIKPAKIPKGATARFSPANLPKSVKKGRIFYTQVGRATLMSRRPLGKRR